MAPAPDTGTVAHLGSSDDSRDAEVRLTKYTCSVMRTLGCSDIDISNRLGHGKHLYVING